MDIRKAKTIYEFFEIDINGNPVPMDTYRNHVCLIVNIAIQDKDVEKRLKFLHNLKHTFVNKNFQILLFPCSQFSSEKISIKKLMQIIGDANLSVGDIFQDIEINGSNCSNLYKFLKLQKPGRMGGFVNADFTIFIIDKNGKPVERVNPNVHPYVLEELIEHYV